MIISVQEANELLNQNKDVVCVDCRFSLQDKNWGREQFSEEHLPNAVYFDLENDLSGEVKNTGGRHPLPDLNHFVNRLAEQGIDHRTPVIIYDNNRAFASRMYWMMTFINHPKVYLMNGSIDDWKAYNFPITSEESIIPKKKYGQYELNKNLLADQDYVKTHKDNNDVVLIDSRSYDRYIGKVEPIDHKAGHIPGAINSEWTNILDEQNRFRSEGDLKTFFEKYNHSKEIIVYCGSGVTATPNVIALWRAGFTNVRLYVGSFSDWISNDHNKVAIQIKE